MAAADSVLSPRFVFTGTCRVEDGQVAELWVNGDLLGLLQQLGATVSPP